MTTADDDLYNIIDKSILFTISIRTENSQESVGCAIVEAKLKLNNQAKQAIKANYRHIDDIRGATEKMDFDDPELAEHNKEFTTAYNHAIDNIRQALNIGDK
jgi:hypothetical protein